MKLRLETQMESVSETKVDSKNLTMVTQYIFTKAHLSSSQGFSASQ